MLSSPAPDLRVCAGFHHKSLRWRVDKMAIWHNFNKNHLVKIWVRSKNLLTIYKMHLCATTHNFIHLTWTFEDLLCKILQVSRFPSGDFALEVESLLWRPYLSFHWVTVFWVIHLSPNSAICWICCLDLVASSKSCWFLGNQLPHPSLSGYLYPAALWISFYLTPCDGNNVNTTLHVRNW